MTVATAALVLPLLFAPSDDVDSASSAPALRPVAAKAGPTSPVGFPRGASATRFRGTAFDTCTAPSESAMAAWRGSPYRALGIYISGAERSCAQPELSADWVQAVTRQGWRLLPIHLGRQAPCSGRTDSPKIRAAVAAEQGVDAAATAVTSARALGLRPGSALYLDMEHYDAAKAACRDTVLRFVSGWTRGLHRRGYLSGVYANLSSGAVHLSQAHDSAAYLRPDALWIARWDNSSALSGWADVPDRQWANHQRVKQYRGDHLETHGGVTMNIDSDSVDAPVATVLRTFKVTRKNRVAARSGPRRRYRAVRTYSAGDRLRVVCQAQGALVRRSRVWDKLGNGRYVPDAFVSTPSRRGFSGRLPRCTYPEQVTSVPRVALRRGPRSSSRVVGRLPAGALAQVVCQLRGSRVGPTRVWNQLRNGAWVSDRFLAGGGTSGFSRGVPRC
jgi:hypothetical protein